MKCPKCQSDYREGAKFCKKCGSKLELVCPECGNINTLDSEFCDECGHKLAFPAEQKPPKELSFE